MFLVTNENMGLLSIYPQELGHRFECPFLLQGLSNLGLISLKLGAVPSCIVFSNILAVLD